MMINKEGGRRTASLGEAASQAISPQVRLWQPEVSSFGLYLKEHCTLNVFETQ